MHTRKVRNTLVGVLFVIAIAASPAPNAQAQIWSGFAPHVVISVGTHSWSVAMGDMNRDGSLDLVVTNPQSNNVSILFGNGAGSFPTTQTFPVGSFPNAVEVGDLNNDGALDIVATNYNNGSFPGSISILLGDGAGGFVTHLVLPVGKGPNSIALGDLSNDGALDIAVANINDSTVTIYIGDGMGGFAPPQTLTTPTLYPKSIAMGDFNRDGALDLVTANQGASVVTLILGDGAGGFAAPTAFPVAPGSGATSVAVGDLNGDGALDLAVPKQSGNVYILLGDGVGGFAPAQAFPAGAQPYVVTMGDLNCDGALDLAVANANSMFVAVLLGDGLGGFSAPQMATVGPGPDSIAMGDLNGDGANDLVTVGFFSSGVSILLNQGLVCPPALDSNGDGVIDAADLANLLANWGVFP